MKKVQFDFIEDFSKRICLLITNVSPEVADFIACQFALESNYGCSNLAVINNNFCGMMFPKLRPTVSHKVEGCDFAGYDTMFDCIIDYFLALAYYRFDTSHFKSIKKFSSSLKSWYCLECDYITKITSIYQSFKSYKDEQNK